MGVRYEDAAKADLRAIIRFGIENDLHDPTGYVRGLRSRFNHLATIKHPGRKGRLLSTREWVVTETPYIAVFQRKGEDVIVIRVLHGAQQWPPTF